MDSIGKVCKIVVFFFFVISKVIAQNYNGKLWDNAVFGAYNPIEFYNGRINIPNDNRIIQTDSGLNFNANHIKYETFFNSGDLYQIISNCNCNNRNYYLCNSIDSVFNQQVLCFAIYRVDSVFQPLSGKKYSFDGEVYNNFGARALAVTKSGSLIACGNRGFISNTYHRNTVPIVFVVDTILNLINSKVCSGFLGSIDFVVEGDSGRFYAGLNLEQLVPA